MESYDRRQSDANANRCRTRSYRDRSAPCICRNISRRAPGDRRQTSRDETVDEFVRTKTSDEIYDDLASRINDAIFDAAEQFRYFTTVDMFRALIIPAALTIVWRAGDSDVLAALFQNPTPDDISGLSDAASE